MNGAKTTPKANDIKLDINMSKEKELEHTFDKYTSKQLKTIIKNGNPLEKKVAKRILQWETKGRTLRSMKREKQFSILAILGGALSIHAGFSGYVVWQYILAGACITSIIVYLLDSGIIRFAKE